MEDDFGAVAKRLCPGLQIRLARFDSGPRLQIFWLVMPRQHMLTGLFCFTIDRMCPSGEIGRHIGLKIRRFVNNGRTGSIPVSGTTYTSAYATLQRPL
jgi:hypothetical protein